LEVPSRWGIFRWLNPDAVFLAIGSIIGRERQLRQDAAVQDAMRTFRLPETGDRSNAAALAYVLYKDSVPESDEKTKDRVAQVMMGYVWAHPETFEAALPWLGHRSDPAAVAELEGVKAKALSGELQPETPPPWLTAAPTEEDAPRPDTVAAKKPDKPATRVPPPHPPEDGDLVRTMMNQGATGRDITRELENRNAFWKVAQREFPTLGTVTNGGDARKALADHVYGFLHHLAQLDARFDYARVMAGWSLEGIPEFWQKFNTVAEAAPSNDPALKVELKILRMKLEQAIMLRIQETYMFNSRYVGELIPPIFEKLGDKFGATLKPSKHLPLRPGERPSFAVIRRGTATGLGRGGSLSIDTYQFGYDHLRRDAPQVHVLATRKYNTEEERSAARRRIDHIIAAEYDYKLKHAYRIMSDWIEILKRQ
jgi:hypothetical protein